MFNIFLANNLSKFNLGKIINGKNPDNICFVDNKNILLSNIANEINNVKNIVITIINSYLSFIVLNFLIFVNRILPPFPS